MKAWTKKHLEWIKTNVHFDSRLWKPHWNIICTKSSTLPKGS